MAVFNAYASYYDLLNAEKNYAQEVEYVIDTIAPYTKDIQTIADLGCGSGKHILELCKNGFDVSGVDLSPQMLQQAEYNYTQLKQEGWGKADFTCADISAIKLNKQFDVVLSLFHVMSYLTSNEQLQNTLKSVNQLLKPQGVFAFDVWYGPAVLTDKPYSRIREFENEQIQVSRTANPVLYANENRVDVNFDIRVTNKQNNETHNIQETHAMRYLFYPEIEALAKANGFEIKTSKQFLTTNDPSFKSWYVFFVLQKV